eukprot:c20598_g1_i1 orf=593-1576(+)
MDKLQIENLPVFSQNVFNGESGSRELLRFSSLKDSPYYCSIPYNLEQDAVAVITDVLEANAARGERMGVKSGCPRSGWGDLCIGKESLETNRADNCVSRWPRSWDAWDNSIPYRERITGTVTTAADYAWGRQADGPGGDCGLLLKESLPMWPQCGTYGGSTTSKTSNHLDLARSAAQSIPLLNFSDQRNLGLKESCSGEHGSIEARYNDSRHRGLQVMAMMAKNDSRGTEFEVGYGNTSASLPRIVDTRTMRKQGEGSGFTAEEVNEDLDNPKGSEEEETQRTRTLHVGTDEEPVIGLKLGKRTYFEDMAVGGSKTAGPSTSSSSPQ